MLALSRGILIALHRIREYRCRMGLAQGLTLPGSLDHKLSNLLLDPSLATFRAFYLALFVFAYGHYECEDLFAAEALILICRHSHLPARAHHGHSILRAPLSSCFINIIASYEL